MPEEGLGRRSVIERPPVEAPLRPQCRCAYARPPAGGGGGESLTSSPLAFAVPSPLWGGLPCEAHQAKPLQLLLLGLKGHTWVLGPEPDSRFSQLSHELLLCGKCLLGPAPAAPPASMLVLPCLRGVVSLSSCCSSPQSIPRTFLCTPWVGRVQVYSLEGPLFLCKTHVVLQINICGQGAAKFRSLLI